MLDEDYRASRGNPTPRLGQFHSEQYFLPTFIWPQTNGTFVQMSRRRPSFLVAFSLQPNTFRRQTRKSTVQPRFVKCTANKLHPTNLLKGFREYASISPGRGREAHSGMPWSRLIGHLLQRAFDCALLSFAFTAYCFLQNIYSSRSSHV